MGHPFKKSLFDNDDSAFQTSFLRTDVLSSQHRSLEPALGHCDTQIAHLQDNPTHLQLDRASGEDACLLAG